MKTIYPMVSMLLPFCAPASDLGHWPARAVNMHDQRQNYVGGTSTTHAAINMPDSIAAKSAYASLMSIASREINELLTNASTFDEKMNALDQHIRENQKNISAWLKTTKANQS